MQGNQRAILGRVTGRVQGVFFRASLRHEAQCRDLAGWVRNLADGSVEFMVQGDPERVQALLDWAWQGPAGSRVADVTTEDVAADSNLHQFEILY